MNYLYFICFITINFFSFTAQAWDGMITGKIQNIDVTGGQNYGFRISLVNTPPLCGSGHAWAYLNDTDSNYETFVSVLLAAKLSDRSVTIYTNKETISGNNYCKIGYIVLN